MAATRELQRVCVFMITGVFAVGLACSASADIIYVPGDTPFIQMAINAAEAMATPPPSIGWRRPCARRGSVTGRKNWRRVRVCSALNCIWGLLFGNEGSIRGR